MSLVIADTMSSLSKWHMGVLTAGLVGTGVCGAEERVDAAVAQTGHNLSPSTRQAPRHLWSHLSSLIDLILKNRQSPETLQGL